MEAVHDPGGRDHGEEVFAVVSFVDFAFASNHAHAVLHTVGVAGRQRLAGHERLAGVGRRSRGNEKIC